MKFTNLKTEYSAIANTAQAAYAECLKDANCNYPILKTAAMVKCSGLSTWTASLIKKTNIKWDLTTKRNLSVSVKNIYMTASKDSVDTSKFYKSARMNTKKKFPS